MAALTAATAQAQEMQRSADVDSTEKLRANDKVLRPFAKVYVEAEKLGSPQQATGAELDAPSAETELQKVLEHEMSTETYNRIAGSLNNNDEARSRVIELIEQERARS